MEKQIRRLAVKECGVETLGVPNVEFRDTRRIKSTTIRVTKYGKRFGWVTLSGDSHIKMDISNEFVWMEPNTNVDLVENKMEDLYICAPTARIESYFCYDSVNAYDAAGLSYGLFHDTAHAGNLQKLAWRFKKKHPGEFERIFRELDIEKRRGRKLFTVGGEVLDLAALRGYRYIRKFIIAAYHPIMQQAQHEQCLWWLKNVRNTNTRPFGFYSKKSEAVILSLSVNMGAGGCRTFLRKVRDGGSENSRLEELIRLVVKKHPSKERRIKEALRVH